MQEVIERIAFAAREDKKVDKRSGVSQRLPISTMENVISNAERRAIRHEEKLVVPRIGDVYAAMPAITGKLELEYEGEMKGADHVSRELIRTAIAKTYDGYFKGTDMNQVVQWFDLGGEIQLADTAGAVEALQSLRGIQGLMEKLVKLNVGPERKPGVASFSGRVRARRTACAQAHWTKRRAAVQRRRKTAEGSRKALRARRHAVSRQKVV